MPKKATPATTVEALLPGEKSTQLRLPDFAAQRLLVSESTLAKWRSLRIGPAFVRVSGGRVAYEDSALDQFIVSRRVQTAISGEAV